MNIDTALATYATHRERLGTLRAINRATIFARLAEANVSRVYVSFDGEGDSGQVQAVLAYRGETLAELPEVEVTLQRLVYGQTHPNESVHPLEEAIEMLCYDALEERHDGWENNDGAFGEFNFDVAARRIDLEFNERLVDYATSHDQL
jgi:hypothetical protein